jgi:hypothetical protein
VQKYGPFIYIKWNIKLGSNLTTVSGKFHFLYTSRKEKTMKPFAFVLSGERRMRERDGVGKPN